LTLQFKTIPDLVSGMIATWSAETNTSLSFSDGDVLLALWQSVATQLDYLQAQVQLVVLMARAKTSVGADLDSFYAQFNFTRLAGNRATGVETFQKFQPTPTQVLVPTGTLVQTVGGAVQYRVVPDSTQSAYSVSANGYVLPAGQTSITATIQSVAVGAASNVLANTLTQFGSSVPGIDLVTNASPITNGIDAESDDDFRARFILYLATLAQATRAAILAAVDGVQQGLLINLLENQTPTGVPALGSFSVIVDDGSGDPPASLLSSIYTAVDSVRAFGVQPFVAAPSQISAVIVLSIHLSGGAVTGPTVNTAVANAIVGMTNELGPGATLYASSVMATALDVPGVTSIDPRSISINGLPTDLTATPAQEIRTTVNAVTVTNY
jgi:uncharacterized phage protein gp47/JayE